MRDSTDKRPGRRPRLPLVAGGLGLLLCLQPAARAQLLDRGPVLDQVEQVTRETERVTRDIGRRAAEAAREAGESVKAGELGELSGTLQSTLDPLTELPARLPVVDARGNTAFVDVAVEDGWRAVDRQWLAMLEPGELALLRQLDIEILEQTDFEGLDLSLLRFRVADELNSREALRRFLPSSLVERFDRNHIYNPQSAGGDSDTRAAAPRPVCGQHLNIGMVDTAIQLDHPAFRDSRIRQKDFLEQGIDRPDAHGTAVAGLLVGTISPHLPGARLYSASVFYSRNQYAQGATMMHLVEGLNWLMGQDVGVINMSLSGPDNRVLAAAIERVIGRGVVVVAAAGNAGPAAPPLYPAAYPGVIAATAVDSDRRIYRWANRGDHLDFAAFGVSVVTARSGGEVGRESGTSMAAPVVSAFAACELLENPADAGEVIDRLAGRALDLGEPGRDPVFGYGLLR